MLWLTVVASREVPLASRSAPVADGPVLLGVGQSRLASHVLPALLRPAAHVARGEVVEQLLKLGVERLPVGADAGIAEAAVLRVGFDYILCKL
jgi:hypothetical protein